MAIQLNLKDIITVDGRNQLCAKDGYYGKDVKSTEWHIPVDLTTVGVDVLENWLVDQIIILINRVGNKACDDDSEKARKYYEEKSSKGIDAADLLPQGRQKMSEEDKAVMKTVKAFRAQGKTPEEIEAALTAAFG